MTVHALLADFAVVAAENIAGSKGCWAAADVPAVRRALDSWRSEHGLARAPLYAFGPSSGGWLAGQAGRHWSDVKAVAMQVMVPVPEDVRPPLPSYSNRYPPLQMTLMQRDAGKLREAHALLAAEWPGREDAELLIAAPHPLTPTFFSDAIVGLSSSSSIAVRDALVAAGYVDKGGTVKQHPSRGTWRSAVLEALGAAPSGAASSAGAAAASSLHPSPRKRASLPQASLQLAMDAIFARLDTAYAFHASTCEFVNSTLAFFRRSARFT